MESAIPVPSVDAGGETDTGPVSALVTPLTGEKWQRISLTVVALAAFVLAAWVTSALWAGLLVGILLAFAIEPAYRKILLFMPRRRTAAAAIATTLVTLTVCGILSALGAVIVSELEHALPRLSSDLAGATPDRVLGKSVLKALAAIGITADLLSSQLASYTTRAAALASGVVSAVLGAAFHGIIGAFMAVITAFYPLKERRPIERRLEQILPLHPQTTRDLTREFRLVGRGTFIGSAAAAVIQGVFATIGFAIGGVPQAVLLGMVTALASFIPVVGTLLVWVPVGVWLILSGHPAGGAFQLVWGVVVTTSLVDYVLRPILVGKESRSHPLLFLIGLIGGIEVLGGVGVLAGPLVMMFFASVMRIFRRDVIHPMRRAHRRTPAATRRFDPYARPSLTPSPVGRVAVAPPRPPGDAGPLSTRTPGRSMPPRVVADTLPSSTEAIRERSGT
ncbi:MAG: AI-2E family transporter [Polyangiaceae bacterium]